MRKEQELLRMNLLNNDHKMPGRKPLVENRMYTGSTDFEPTGKIGQLSGPTGKNRFDSIVDGPSYTGRSSVINNTFALVISLTLHGHSSTPFSSQKLSVAPFESSRRDTHNQKK